MRFLLLCSLCVACGARTTLNVDDEPDAAVPDAMIDGFFPDTPGFDVGPRPDAPPVGLVLDCGPARMTTPGTRVDIQAVVTLGELAFGTWVIEEVPPLSMVVPPDPPDSPRASVFVDVPGLFAYRFIGTSPSGEEASCIAEIFSVAGPPIASCPRDEILGFPLEPISVMGAGFDDDGPVTYSWSLASSPPFSSPRLEGTEDPVLTFASDLAGTYVLELTVVDVFGESDTCQARVRLLAPPSIACDTTDAFTGPTREPLEVFLAVSDDTSVVRHEWEIISRPPSSSATVESIFDNRMIFTPDKQGVYEILYTATDTDGLSSTCLVTAIGLPTPPTLTCPELVETPPLTTVAILAEAIDDGDSLSYMWELASREVGSSAGPPSPRNRAETNFTPDIAGEYLLRVTVTDDDGEFATCETTVLAFSDEGLRVEMFWNTGGSTDMDLHLAREEATHWFDEGGSDDDCYYANCNADDGDVLEWYAPGPDDNPRLDLDDTTGFGPENINIDEPRSGTYTIGVHAYSGRGDVTVRVYCGGDRTFPRAEFGPVTLTSPGGGGPTSRFWRVAEVDITGPASCTIRDLAGADGTPNITSRANAETTL